MDSPVSLVKVKKSLQFLDIDASSSEENSFIQSCRYNLRNRGPAKFVTMVERECPICLSKVFEKPVVVNCGHTFCDKCIKLLLEKYKNCPICNQVLIKALFLCDTSYTIRLTRECCSPRVTRSANRLKGRAKHSGKQQGDEERNVTNRGSVPRSRKVPSKLREKRKTEVPRS
ncbi:E3 ubiquitin-protein ligase RNF114-like [Toxorhynchites rutilus septentrionalis]|uniref:E3 ubiquitin-protein ligase RNF114-like n=1 Tax=Toxorhynchites rutilus septentrionalis TaxID=329112 RepID=UPI00247ABFF1|nr:E3 ubiquitin-protein ligase RNF114-like [Toxorhynchites rutilus septentrionalis]